MYGDNNKLDGFNVYKASHFPLVYYFLGDLSVKGRKPS